MKEIFDFQQTVDAQVGTSALTAAEVHVQHIKEVHAEQVERLGLPPVPQDGSVDLFGALRVMPKIMVNLEVSVSTASPVIQGMLASGQ